MLTKENTMAIHLFEKYELKDGRKGWAVDILGNGEACIFELDQKGLEDRVIQVTEDDIKTTAQ